MDDQLGDLSRIPKCLHWGGGESEGRAPLSGFPKNHGIEFVDPTEALQAATRARFLYPIDTVGHLNAEGNEVLTTEVSVKAGTLSRRLPSWPVSV